MEKFDRKWIVGGLLLVAAIGMYLVGHRIAFDGVAWLSSPSQQTAGSLLVALLGSAFMFAAWRDASRKQGVLARETLAPFSASKQVLELRGKLQSYRLRTIRAGRRARPVMLVLEASVCGTRDERQSGEAGDDIAIEHDDTWDLLRIHGRLVFSRRECDRTLWQTFLDDIASGIRVQRVVCVLHAASVRYDPPALAYGRSQAIQKRVHELSLALGRRPRLHVVVTHSDSLQGYREWVSTHDVPEFSRFLGEGTPHFYAQVAQRLTAWVREESADERAWLQRVGDGKQAARAMTFRRQWATFGANLEAFLSDTFPTAPQRHAWPVRSVQVLPGRWDDSGQHGRTPFDIQLEPGAVRRIVRRVAAWSRKHRACLIVVSIVVVMGSVAGGYVYERRPLDELSVAVDAAGAATTSPRDRLIARQRLEHLADQDSDRTFLRAGLAGDARHAYWSALDDVFADPARERLACRLAQDTGQPPWHRLYDTLRVYLTLGGQGKATTDEMRQWFARDRDERTRNDGLAPFFAAWLQSLAGRRAVPIDDASVQRARDALASRSVADRLYERMLLHLAESRRPDVSIATMAGEGGTLLLSRRSDAPLDRGVPWAYTRDGYAAVRQQLPAEVTAFVKDDAWVNGKPFHEGSEGLARQVLDSYARDYIRAWESFLKDVTITGMTTPEDTVIRTRALAAATSPLFSLLDQAAVQTRLTTSAPSTEPGRAKDEKAMWEPEFRLVEHAVTHHFEALSDAMEDGEDHWKAHMHAALVRASIDAQNLNAAVALGLSPETSEASNRVQEATSLAPMLLTPLLQTLPPSLHASEQKSRLRSIDRAISQSVLPECRAVTTHRYPFEREATVETLPQDFERLFATDGLLQAFYEKQLATLVSDRYADRKLGKDLPRTFEAAADIGQHFIDAPTRHVGAQIDVTPVRMDADIASFVLTVNQEPFEYAHGPIRTRSYAWSDRSGTRITAAMLMLNGHRVQRTWDGSWAWLHLVDNASQGPHSVTDGAVHLRLDGHEVVLKILLSGTVVPILVDELRNFQCPMSNMSRITAPTDAWR